MAKLVHHVRSEIAETPQLRPSENFGHALIDLERKSPNEVFNDKNVLAEISQSFRHGYESLGGTICWVFYALAANPDVRTALERACKEHR